jgi:hypothetical protein
MDNSQLILSFVFLIVLMYVLWRLFMMNKCCNSENFWGGWFPVLYLNQPLPSFSRTGVDAATDKPKFFIF